MLQKLLGLLFPQKQKTLKSTYTKIINKVLLDYCGLDENNKPNAQIKGWFERGDAFLLDIKRSAGYPINKVLNLEDELQEVFSHINPDIVVSVDKNPLRVTVGKEIPDKQYLETYGRSIVAKFEQNKMIACPGVAYVGKEIELFGLSFKNESFAHILISGSTGAGKTMLSLSLLLTLAALNSPEVCTIIVCDPKGGIDFEVLQNLPHIPDQKVFVTNREINTAITSVHNELMRRIETQDKSSLNRHIVLVVDEFHNFSDDTKAVNKLKDIAAMGRFWGIHLIAITQRPDHKSIDTTLRSNLVGHFMGRMNRLGNKGIGDAESNEQQAKLPGKGLFIAQSSTANKRVQGFWISDIAGEVTAIQNKFKGLQPHFLPTMPTDTKTEIGAEIAGSTDSDELPNSLAQWQPLFDMAKSAIEQGEEITQSWFRKMAPDVMNKQINANTAQKLVDLLAS